ncbi:hypothetical protein [Deinococcus sp. RL]|uniref:hypothetical protein n=1 Tax=Deinococcus sp. RL TaxID=1489678 RepID=UPI0005599AFC|nr:hypothetical protein [Deinococcus sp. RL]
MTRPSALDLTPFVERGRTLLARAGGDPVDAARLAAALGEPELGRALLAGSGGLLDHADAARVLAQAPGMPLPAQALAPFRFPSLTPGEREVFVRVLASALLRTEGAPRPAPVELPPGLWVLPAEAHEERRQRAGLEVLGARPGTPLTLALASRIGVPGATARLGAAHPGPLRVEVLEDVVRTLGAAWSWDLPDLAGLLAGPLLLDGLQTLPAELLETVGELLADAARLFGWTVVGLPGVERRWPAAFQLLSSSDTRGASSPAPRLSVCETALPRLAADLARQPGDTLALLPSRASAARLAGLWPGSVLLSTSLCPAHLAERAAVLAQSRARGEAVRVVATILPPAAAGSFDTVWQVASPLPHVVEAAALARRELKLCRLRDVAVPQGWRRELHLTREWLGDPPVLPGPEGQRAYDAALLSGGASWAAGLRTHREALDYASFAAELRPRPGTSLPVLIPYDDRARSLIAAYRETGRMSGEALNYAAWLTPTEAQRAVSRGQAEVRGWALVWTGPYDPVYGLAGEAVRGAPEEEA